MIKVYVWVNECICACLAWPKAYASFVWVCNWLWVKINETTREYVIIIILIMIITIIIMKKPL